MKLTPITDEWREAYYSGRQDRAYTALGSRLTRKGAVFRVWAPDALLVSVVGDFNAWTPGCHVMRRLPDGFWETEIEGLRAGDTYKYAISARDGQTLWKADPYAFWAEKRPGSASRLYEPDGYRWTDAEWMERRRAHKVYHAPLNVYEVHAGSWRRPDGETPSYGWLKRHLIPYVKEMGFTHIELMPMTEYPLDDSWGYQCTGYFAATARYGDPKDFKSFINACHASGIGVIMDWAPAHFPKDPQGLVEFDGSRLYESTDPLMGEHPSWGTRIFDYGKGAVRSFLISSALFWLREYHMDGIRVDAVASMLYLDYDRRDGRWRRNKFGGKENLEAVDFLQRLNEAAFAFDDSVLMIAEESTAWPAVTGPTFTGGLGFNLKWNMGWMNDCLRYVKTDPYFRSYCHRDLTFSLLYAFSENFLLPLSHDEVVHMKGSLYGKMPGSPAQKRAGVRMFWAYMLAHPGKKLLFMGAELGQEAEWDFASELRWTEAQTPENLALTEYFRAANRFYLASPELWELDFDPEGFLWLAPDESDRNIVAFLRMDEAGERLYCAFNFSGVKSEGFRLGVPEKGEFRVCFSSEQAWRVGRRLRTQPVEAHDQAQSLLLELPPLSAVFFRKSRRGDPKKSGKENLL